MGEEWEGGGGVSGRHGTEVSRRVAANTDGRRTSVQKPPQSRPPHRTPRSSLMHWAGGAF
eukprot:scaffold15925_cov101-Isochrysis_galbana.AAC.1